jgi:hypothetical protein
MALPSPRRSAIALAAAALFCGQSILGCGLFARKIVPALKFGPCIPSKTCYGRYVWRSRACSLTVLKSGV